MSIDIETFARDHAPLMTKPTLSLFENILNRHHAAILEVICGQQTQIEALEKACEGYRLQVEELKHQVGVHGP